MNNAILTPAALLEIVTEYRKYNRIAEEAAAQAEALKDALKAHLTAINAEEVSDLTYKVTWHTVNGTKIDTTALKKDLPDIAAAYTRPNNYRRMIIS